MSDLPPETSDSWLRMALEWLDEHVGGRNDHKWEYRVESVRRVGSLQLEADVSVWLRNGSQYGPMWCGYEYWTYQENEWSSFSLPQ